jgi:hypothetical protein
MSLGGVCELQCGESLAWNESKPIAGELQPCCLATHQLARDRLFAKLAQVVQHRPWPGHGALRASVY